jgi:hypothetical protein
METSKNAISNISEKAGGLALLSDGTLAEYSKKFSKSMDIIANVLNEDRNKSTFVINNDTPVLDIEYTVERFKKNTQPLDETQIKTGINYNSPIFFKVKLVNDNTLIIDDNLNEYILKNIFDKTRATISCNKDSVSSTPFNTVNLSDNLFECIYYALNIKNVYENTQNPIDVNIRKDTIKRLRNIISENIENYELNEYLKNYKLKKTNIQNNSIHKFIEENLKLFTPKVMNLPRKQFQEFGADANNLLENKDFFILLDSLKKFVTTDDYWGDNYAVQIFEKYYNIKIILFDLDYDRIVCNAKILFKSKGQPGQDVTAPNIDPTGLNYLFMSYYRYKNYDYIYNIIQFLSSTISDEDQRKYIYKYNEIPDFIQKSILDNCVKNTDRPYSYYFKSVNSLSSLKSKTLGGGSNLPYGPFFTNIKYPVCDDFYEFIEKRKQPTSEPEPSSPSPSPAQTEEQPEELSSSLLDFDLDENKPPSNVETPKIKSTQDEDNNFIRKVMNDPGYEVIDNTGGGNCFFLAFLDSFNYSDKDKEYGLQNLRSYLSEQITEDTYQEWKSYSNSDNTVAKEYTFMKNINSLDDLKKLIKTSGYWADGWSIDKIEKRSNVKFIIFQKNLNNYTIKIVGKDERNEHLTYIMLEFSDIEDGAGNVSSHYKLIAYNNKRQFSFSELPKGVKAMLIKYPNLTKEVTHFIKKNPFDMF